jgi:hypothetical protein
MRAGERNRISLSGTPVNRIKMCSSNMT